jgi:hypothetical protein
MVEIEYLNSDGDPFHLNIPSEYIGSNEVGGE